MQRLVPTVWCTDNATDLADFYAAALPDAARGDTFSLGGTPVAADVSIGELTISFLNAGAPREITPGVSFFINFHPDELELLDATFQRLSDGATVLMPLGEYDFSPRFAWIADANGVNWQLTINDRDQRVTPCLLFAGEQYGAARAATDLYVSTLPDSRVLTQPASGDVGYSEVEILGQLCVIQESDPHSFSFTEGISLLALATSQEEIDSWWDALAAHPGRCGWLTDPYGLSWQIAPANFHELLSRPHAQEKLAEMDKLVIDEF